MLTGLQTIDDWHQSVMQLASQLLHCHDYEVQDIYRTTLSVLEQTFGHEQQIMEEFRFPAIQCHLEQHARVLATMHHLHPAVMNGEHAIARRVAGELLPDWLQLHMATQDAALGIWVACCQDAQQSSVFDQLTAFRDQLAHLPQPHYSDGLQSHPFQYPAHERARQEHIERMR